MQFTCPPHNLSTCLITFPDSGDIVQMRQHQGEIATVVCYCSLYGDCWTTGEEGYEPKSVRGCKPDPKREFEW